MHVVSTYHGGPCQFALDCTGQSKNFIVIKTTFDCLADKTFTVPAVTVLKNAVDVIL